LVRLLALPLPPNSGGLLYIYIPAPTGALVSHTTKRRKSITWLQQASVIFIMPLGAQTVSVMSLTLRSAKTSMQATEALEVRGHIPEQLQAG
jgi:hypothetical protein